MRRYSSCRALLVVCGTLAMRFLLRRFYGLHPDHGLAEGGAERLAFRIGERGIARLADRGCLLARVGGRRVLDQRVGDGEKVRLAAAMRLAVALDEPRALRHFVGQR